MTEGGENSSSESGAESDSGLISHIAYAVEGADSNSMASANYYAERFQNSNAQGNFHGDSSLEAIIATEENQKKTPQEFLGYSIHTDRRPTSVEYQNLAEAIIYEREAGNLPRTTITENPDSVQYYLDSWLDALDEFKSDPAKFQALQEYSRSIGREIEEPMYAGIYDSDSISGARTIAGKTIDANIDRGSMLDSISSTTGIPYTYLEEMLIAHEYFHNGQPNSVIYGEPFPYVAELDVEYNMSQFFKDKSQASNNELDKMNYSNLSRYCLVRYEFVKYAMANGIDISLQNTTERTIE